MRGEPPSLQQVPTSNSPSPHLAPPGSSNRSARPPAGMALVTRFLKLADHDDTHVFTLVGTKSVTRDLNREIHSKEFRWEVYLPGFAGTQNHFNFLSVSNTHMKFVIPIFM